MIIKETKIDDVVEINEYGQLYINPYYGCSAGCPFCYWLNFEGWENKIEARMNFPDKLEAFCAEKGNKKQRIYIGSYCDPYMEVEAEYGLMRNTMEILCKYQMPVTVCTSARSELVLRDLDIFRKMNDLLIVTELCRFDQMKRMRDGLEHIGIRVANKLKENGIRVAATFAPIMPGVTDVERVRHSLFDDIELYIDTMYIEKGSIQEKRVLNSIKDWDPDLVPAYQEYIDKKNTEFDLYVDSLIGNRNIRRCPVED